MRSHDEENITFQLHDNFFLELFFVCQTFNKASSTKEHYTQHEKDVNCVQYEILTSARESVKLLVVWKFVHTETVEQTNLIGRKSLIGPNNLYLHDNVMLT